ncbi:low-density lipoprotein receptor-related protein 11 [Gadus chalcogrammus]|uniref:low-density lipoprotein receptor-related protein 11 n=1 Tax=Gadus chalcogrammus TaxID=1042646 RepID=UPI0024C4DED4|nr:low-density lipoprotein receptor-related protein 11 [Gadus chalcogrammus]
MEGMRSHRCVNMAQHQHQHQHRLFYCVLLLLCAVRTISARASQISDLKSKITGVEELLEEFRKQLQQDQAYSTGRQGGGGAVVDSCLGEFTSADELIIRAKASIEQGATFLSPGPVYNWKDCLHACCSEPHCTLAVVQEDLGESEESLHCYLFNCTYRNKNVCSFTPQQGFSTYSRGANATVGHPSPAPLSSSGGSSDKNTAAAAGPAHTPTNDDDPKVVDEPPRSDAGQDVVIQLPTDWAVLDGRDSLDDYGVSRYEWTLVQGEPSVSMKVSHPGLLKISGLQQGEYTFQMTVTDTGGQKSSDNVSVTVLAPERLAEVCTGRCSHYQFLCDDGCCIDIDYACDGKQHCPDNSDEDFCPKFESSRKSVTHPVSGGAVSHSVPAASQIEGADSTLRAGPEVRKTVESVVPHPVAPEPRDRTKAAPPPPPPPPAHQGPSVQDAPAGQDPCAASPVVGPCKGTFPRWYYDREAGECKHFLYGGCQGNHNNFLQESDCVNECIQKSPIVKPTTVPTPTPATTQSHTEGFKELMARGHVELEVPVSKPYPAKDGHPVPESGAILPLALGILITSLLLLMIGCRLRLVRHKLKKTRPLTTEESDYLINGMYL